MSEADVKTLLAIAISVFIAILGLLVVLRRKKGRVMSEDKSLMPLKDFISKTITQIVEGIAQAQEKERGKEKDSRATINPTVASSKDCSSGMAYASQGTPTASLVKFNISVTVAKEKGGGLILKAGAKSSLGVGVSGSAEAGVNGKLESARTQENQIEFTVPIIWTRP